MHNSLAMCHFCWEFIINIEFQWVAGLCGNFSGMRNYPWRAEKVWFVEILVSEELSTSDWVKTLMTSSLKFSASVFLCSWNLSREWFWLEKWINTVLIRESEASWLFIWGIKNKWTSKQWKLVVFKNVFLQTSAASFRAWRTLLSRTRSAAICNFLLNLADLAVWF